ncbi:2637_t:CDS:2 [Rhizophagus irregularis]|nr:2637_t:CDS:2 [Rhizophagus irregularis]
MGFFVVCVLKEAKTVISDKVVKVSPTDSFQFHDIFNAATNEQFESYGVQVFLRKPPEKWVYVEEGLEERSLSLGEFFDGLNQYRHDQHYNLFYFTGRHAKYNLMRDKLEQLASSLELSAVQPWATNEQWCNITEEVFILTSSMQKYASNLEKINKSMKQIHLSDTPARHPANDLIVYTIDSCRKIDAQYKQLQDHLLNVDYYTEVDLESFLPKDAIQREGYICTW